MADGPERGEAWAGGTGSEAPAGPAKRDRAGPPRRPGSDLEAVGFFLGRDRPGDPLAPEDEEGRTREDAQVSTWGTVTQGENTGEGIRFGERYGISFWTCCV